MEETEGEEVEEIEEEAEVAVKVEEVEAPLTRERKREVSWNLSSNLTQSSMVKVEMKEENSSDNGNRTKPFEN